MINHVVLFKLRDFSEEEKMEVIAELKSKLLALKTKIAEVKYIEVGENYELAAGSYDLALISHFESLEDLDKYRTHPEHLKVVERIGQTTVARAVVDYQF